MSELLLDRAGRRRSPATLPGFHAGHAPGKKGLRYPADPPKVDEVIAVMRAAGDGDHGRRLRALIVLLWRAGLRIQEALMLTEGDLDQGGEPLACQLSAPGHPSRPTGHSGYGGPAIEASDTGSRHDAAPSEVHPHVETTAARRFCSATASSPRGRSRFAYGSRTPRLDS